MAVLDLALRTADTNSELMGVNPKFYLVVDVTAIVSSPVITPKIELFDPVSGKYIAVWTAAATITTVSTTTYCFTDEDAPYASIDNVTEIVELPVTDQIRVMMGHADADAITYSVNILSVVR